MTPDLLRHILTHELKAERKEDIYTLADKANVLLSGSENVLTVAKVTEVGFKDGYIVLNSEDGTFYCADDKIFGIRAEPSTSRTDKRPGFH